MKYLKLLLFLIIGFNCSHAVNVEKLRIYQTPDIPSIVKALNVVINKLDKEEIFTKQQMLDVINNSNFKDHSCKGPAHKYYALEIIFTTGIWSDRHEDYCIYSKYERFKKMCLVGIFDGFHNITIKNESKIHKTVFAHELLHYFRRYIKGNGDEEFYKDHEPEGFWKDLVGLKANDEIGILNEELKKEGL